MGDMSILGQRLRTVDHLAVAVDDLEEAVCFYRDRLGFTEVERRTTEGLKTGMESAVMKAGDLRVVLLRGTTEESQVTRYVREYGPGVQHVAFQVEGIESVVADLKERGLLFDTGVIEAPGLKQAFSKRDPISGMMFELIERTGEEGFNEANVRKLFQSLEESDSF
jgi:methylmalonyl-CoA/ethylmalonyl-CoA epimerase